MKMKKLIFILLLASLFFIGCVDQNLSIDVSSNNTNFYKQENLSLVSMKISTDKTFYYSNELINFTIEINSSKEMRDLFFTTYGILDKWNRYRLNETRILNLSNGINRIEFSYITPSCYGCAGIIPDNYTIVAMLIKGNETIANTTCKIEIRG